MDEITQTKNEVVNDLGMFEEELSLDKELINFRLLPDNAIPIAPTVGKRFSEFFDEGVKAISARHMEWRANMKEFLNEDAIDATTPKENTVRTSVETLVDYTYMRNPTAEITAYDSEDKALSTLLQKILDALMNKRTLPGINLRPKMLKQIINAHLTNFGILELTWQGEKGSIEQVLEINNKVKEQIKEEKDQEQAGRLYKLLDILQQELDTRKHIGISVRVRSPFSLIVDPNCEEIDLSDAKWVMDRDVMNIDHIRAEYMIHDEEANTFYFKYDNNTRFDYGTDVSITTQATSEASIIDAIMPEVDAEQAKLRVKNTLPIVKVYDRTTKLIYFYIEGQWETPLWVYEDEMELSRFFPFFILAFSSCLNSIIQSGEVTHYLPFQKEMHKIDEQISNIRNKAFNKYLFNSGVIDAAEATKLFNFLDKPSTKIEALPIKLRDQDRALSEIFEPVKMPMTQFTEIFDKQDLRGALSRTTRITEAMKGAEFKTNTTNQAINTYNEFAANRGESLTDKIELSTEALLWSICEIIISKMSVAQVSQLITVKEAQAFQNMNVTEFNNIYNLAIAAGSIEKPTSQAKKQEAFQIIQMLGQFGTTAPMTTLGIVSKLLRSAFSKSLVSDSDLELLKEEGAAAMQKGISTQQGQQPPQAQPQAQPQQ